MDASTGKLYPTVEDALAKGVKEEDLVKLTGPKEANEKISAKVQQAYSFDKERRKRKAQRESRRRNRK